MNTKLEKALKESYNLLKPHSERYRVDFDRYLFSLSLIMKIPDIKKKRVLDIGTGIGIMPIALRKLGISSDGLDRYIFPDAENKMFGFENIKELQITWERENVEVHNSDIYDELPQNIYPTDVIISEATIEHLKDPKKFLEKCYSMLSEGGYIIITTPNLSTLLKRVRFLFGLSPYWPIESFFRDGENFTGHWREYTMPELIYMCEKTGFEVVEKHIKNNLAKFKNTLSFKKNLRALFSFLSNLIPGSGEMNYILCRKKN